MATICNAPAACGGGSTPTTCGGGTTPVTCTHNLSQVTVNAKCTTSGSVTEKCSKCCYSKVISTTPALGHKHDNSWKDYSNTQHKQVCLTCGEALRYENHATSGTCKCGKLISGSGGSSEGSTATTSGLYYSGNIGAAWIRETPVTLGEIISGVYTLEVDYITWSTAASILALSSSYSLFNDIKSLLIGGATDVVISKLIISSLGVTGTPATIATFVVSGVIALGWSWLESIDRELMQNCFKNMSETEYMKVQFLYASNMVNKIYSIISKTATIPNPYPNLSGNWYRDKFGYLYSY